MFTFCLAAPMTVGNHRLSLVSMRRNITSWSSISDSNCLTSFCTWSFMLSDVERNISKSWASSHSVQCNLRNDPVKLLIVTYRIIDAYLPETEWPGIAIDRHIPLAFWGKRWDSWSNCYSIFIIWSVDKTAEINCKVDILCHIIAYTILAGLTNSYTDQFTIFIYHCNIL